jgi:hypothetical protein
MTRVKQNFIFYKSVLMSFLEKFKNQTMTRTQMRHVVGGLICTNGGASTECSAGSICVINGGCVRCGIGGEDVCASSVPKKGTQTA